MTSGNTFVKRSFLARIRLLPTGVNHESLSTAALGPQKASQWASLATFDLYHSFSMMNWSQKRTQQKMQQSNESSSQGSRGGTTVRNNRRVHRLQEGGWAPRNTAEINYGAHKLLESRDLPHLQGQGS